MVPVKVQRDVSRWVPPEFTDVGGGPHVGRRAGGQEIGRATLRDPWGLPGTCAQAGPSHLAADADQGMARSAHEPR